VISTITNGAATLTLPATTGTLAINGPSFSAYIGTNQVLATANVQTLLELSTEEWDTNSCFNNTGSTVTLNGISVPAYSFAPNVAGYYIVGGALSTNGGNFQSVFLNKNGSNYKILASWYPSSTYFSQCSSAMVYMNGTSDYINILAQSSATETFYAGSTNTTFFAAMVRGA
jgi:hypothetical protein